MWMWCDMIVVLYYMRRRGKEAERFFTWGRHHICSRSSMHDRLFLQLHHLQGKGPIHKAIHRQTQRLSDNEWRVVRSIAASSYREIIGNHALLHHPIMALRSVSQLSYNEGSVNAWWMLSNTSYGYILWYVSTVYSVSIFVSTSPCWSMGPGPRLSQQVYQESDLWSCAPLSVPSPLYRGGVGSDISEYWEEWRIGSTTKTLTRIIGLLPHVAF